MISRPEKKQTPLLFKPYMVNAILAEIKLQTRRLNGLEWYNKDPDNWRLEGDFFISKDDSVKAKIPYCPYGKPGDLIWVRESHAIVPRTAYAQSPGVEQILRYDDNHDAAIFCAGWDLSQGGIKWRPSIHMPKWACRLWLEIRKIRIERLLDITDGDAILEGTYIEINPNKSMAGYPVGTRSNDGKEVGLFPGDPKLDFLALFASIHGQALVDANPWVWVISFEKVEAPDAY